jgi:hypothetical protein
MPAGAEASHGRTRRRGVWLVLAAVGAVTVLAWAVFSGAIVSSHSPGASAMPHVGERWSRGDFQAGVNVSYYATAVVDPTAHTPGLLDRLVRDHVNSVALAFPFYTASPTASEVSPGPGTPTDEAIGYFVRQAHERGLAVMLRPLLDEGSLLPTASRTTIQPASAAAWFDSYDRLIVGYAKLAQQLRIEMFDVGTELTSMEAYTTSWTHLLSEVRQVYYGEVTYSANWYDYSAAMAFWPLLDFVSIDAYWPLQVESPSVDNLVAAMSVPVGQALTAARAVGKVLVFTEIGVASQRTSYEVPWMSQKGAPVDLNHQAAYYTATCQATNAVGGLYWWDVNIDPLADPSTDAGFSLIGKPSENVMRNCFGQRSTQQH